MFVQTLNVCRDSSFLGNLMFFISKHDIYGSISETRSCVTNGAVSDSHSQRCSGGHAPLLAQREEIINRTTNLTSPQKLVGFFLYFVS